MYTLRSREEIEQRLRVELEDAERELHQASPEELAAARARFKRALHQFTQLVVHGELPKEARWA